MKARALPPDDQAGPLPEDLTEEESEEIDGLEEGLEGGGASSDPELCLYRDRTVLLLRRYMRMSLEAGRLPSLLGREFFRTRFTGYQAHTFEDVVIFVHDVEACLEELDPSDQELIAMIALQEHSQAEVAKLLGCTRRSVVRQYAETLDRASEVLLRRRIMDTFPGREPFRENSCQEGKKDDSFVSDCHEWENKF